jgi:hypothetical protein
MKNNELKLNRFIEKAKIIFDGKFGFNKTIERNSMKKDKCKLHNLDIVYIKYDYTLSDYDSLVTFINDKINKHFYNKLCIN